MKVIIIEDEEAATRRLKKMLLELDASIEILAMLDSVETSINWFGSNQQPDIIFLDIHLGDGSGFELFEHIDIQQAVIFTTAYDQYALRAFRVNAIDYLLKPIKKKDLENALTKYSRFNPNNTVDYKTVVRALVPKKQKRFLIKTGQQFKLFPSADIAYFYTKDKLTYLVAYDGKKYVVDQSLDKIDEEIDEEAFFRINRQFIINLKAIQKMHAYSKSRVKIDLTPPCQIETVVSTERSPYFKKWLIGD